MPATTTRGLMLPCPCCGEGQATITLSLADPNDLHCCDCDCGFTLDDVRAFIAKWQPILAWIDQFPKGGE